MSNRLTELISRWAKRADRKDEGSIPSEAVSGTSLRRILKWGYLYVLRYTGLLSLAKWWIRTHGAVVLTFHRVLHDDAAAQTCSLPALVIREATFKSALRYVKKQFSLIDLANGAPCQNHNRIQIVVTFDDGWEDNASTAFPIASKLQVPFTVFICPGLIDAPIPFWPERVVALTRCATTSSEALLHAREVLASNGYSEWVKAVVHAGAEWACALIERLKSLPGPERERLLQLLSSEANLEFVNQGVDRTMSWSQVAELYGAGVSFGCHTQSHEILTMLPIPRVEQEIRESTTAIEEHIGECSLFSYPNGDASSTVEGVVERHGYKLAFINSPGIWHSNTDPLLIPRINVNEDSLTDLGGHFSTLAFDFQVFWNAFIHRNTSRTAHSVFISRVALPKTEEPEDKSLYLRRRKVRQSV